MNRYQFLYATLVLEVIEVFTDGGVPDHPECWGAKLISAISNIADTSFCIVLQCRTPADICGSALGSQEGHRDHI
eukprot:5819299-Amphidinium_carterae.1